MLRSLSRCRDLLFVTLALAGAAQAAPPANPIPFQYDSQDKTGIREVRDPCIIHEGDTYYLVFTMWPFSAPDPSRRDWADLGSSPGIRVFTSKDLRTWTPGPWLVKSADLPNDCPYKHRFWAPEIHKFAGKFYLIFTADNWVNRPPDMNPGQGMYAFVGVADQPQGPYQHITKIPDGPCDTTLFADAAGKTYAVMPAHDISIQQIDLTHLPEGKLTWIGPRRVIATADNSDIHQSTPATYLEGPWVQKIGQRYALFYAAFYRNAVNPNQSEYWTGVSYATSPQGPWKKDPRGRVFMGGHLAVFKGPDGRDWFSYRSEVDSSRGLLCVSPFDIGADGRVIPHPDATATPQPAKENK